MEQQHEKTISLPELKFSLVARSQEPVLKVDPKPPIIREMDIIQPVREYTVVLAKGSNEIQVFDKQGKRIEGLITTPTMILDWHAYAKKDAVNEGQYGYMAIDVSAMPFKDRIFYRSVNQFPQLLQPAVKAYIEQKTRDGNTAEFPYRSWRLETDKIDQILVEKKMDIFFFINQILKIG